MGNEFNGRRIVSRCCVCARQLLDGIWLTATKGAPAEADEHVSHTYCPDCLATTSPKRRTSGRAMLVRPPSPGERQP